MMRVPTGKVLSNCVGLVCRACVSTLMVKRSPLTKKVVRSQISSMRATALPLTGAGVDDVISYD